MFQFLSEEGFTRIILSIAWLRKQRLSETNRPSWERRAGLGSVEYRLMQSVRATFQRGALEWVALWWLYLDALWDAAWMLCSTNATSQLRRLSKWVKKGTIKLI